ncbi:hypothetical protein FRC00_003169 [Tulasnella sp. 408]|nr:hypothetical protein FRC00_003169 [Tulasnella sp. 408]
MDESQGFQHTHRRGLHTKRLLRQGGIDSPLYDASEEDNDGKGDEASSFSGSYIPRRKSTVVDSSPNLNARDAGSPSRPLTIYDPGHHPASASVSTLSNNISGSLRRDRADSPTYDGDVESSATGRQDLHPPSPDAIITPLSNTAPDRSTTQPPSSSPSSATLWKDHKIPHTPSHAGESKPQLDSICSLQDASPDSLPSAASETLSSTAQTSVLGSSAMAAEDIRAYVQAVIDANPNSARPYRPRTPPQGRPVRIYADGVYDIFHFGHALQLRQAKLSFPEVHLMVGVCSDELCSEHKSRTVMTHIERCESVRHCRWVDEIIPDAPWVINQEFIDKYRIDYVAHDDDPYKGSDGSDDVYHYVKQTGQFIPTRRTPGVSTSELLERIVAGYREGDWDAKLVKIGHPELTSRAPSRATSRPESRIGTAHPPETLRVEGGGT